jgi:GNAT superfamily N-acetyltransferase
MARTEVDVQQLDASRRSDFFAYHCAANDSDWCHCVAWWTESWDGWGDRSAAQNRALRESLFDAGQYDGFLAYLDGMPVGWCQVGPRDRLQKLTSQYALAPDPGVWAVTCFNVAPRVRRQGVAAALLDSVLEAMRARGVGAVQAFPRRNAREPGDLWTGPEAVYRRAGFKVEADDPERPVLRWTSS